MNSTSPAVSASFATATSVTSSRCVRSSSRRPVSLALASLLLGFLSAPAAPSMQVEERVVGPVLGPDTRQFNPHSVSPRGVRLATLVRKGSRVAINVDGTEGPRFDQVMPPTFAHIDPRSAQAMQGVIAALTPIGPGFTQSGYGRAGPVVFSRDGKRFAYIAREAQEWVLMVDAKEMLRLPAEGIVSGVTIQGPSGTVDLRLEFTGETGKHLLFARSVYGGFELWVDGKKMPGLYTSAGDATNGFTDPIVSADGSRFAYVAQMDRDKQALIVDGKPASYFGTSPRFSPDGKVLYTLAQNPSTGEQALLIDGKPAVRGTEIRLFLPAVSNRYGAIVTERSPSGAKSFVVIDGAKVAATEVSGPDSRIESLVFSPDGKHHAAACKASQNVSYVVSDGKKLQRYDEIFPASLRFSPDSTRLGYVAHSAGKSFAVIGDDESDPFDGNAVFAFSPNSKRVAWGGPKMGTSGTRFFVDGKSVGAGSMLIFSPDGTRFAFTTEPHKEIYLDGKNTGLRGDKFSFSPDGKHFVVFGNKPSADPKAGPLQALAAPEKIGLFVDGQHVWGNADQQNLRYRAFTPDSQHLIWNSDEPAVGAKAGPGKYEWVTYLDGQVVARFDREPATLGFIYSTMSYQFMDAPPAWSTDADGTFSFLGPVDDTIKRFTVRTSSGIGIDAMLAEAVAAPARAAAAEAEAKKQAEEAAAAKKAKAAADAAEAAAKQKADYDAAIAKRKADYDAAIAKRKADYEAAIAKQKAAAAAKLAELEAARKKAFGK